MMKLLEKILKEFVRYYCSVVFLVVVLFLPLVAYAETITITESAKYIMGDGETPLIASKRAVELARRQASEKVAVHIESFTKSINNIITEDVIKTTSAAIMNDKHTPIIKRSTDSAGTFIVEATITVDIDTDKVMSLIDSAIKSKDYEEKYNELSSKNKELSSQNIELKKSLQELQEEKLRLQAKSNTSTVVVKQSTPQSAPQSTSQGTIERIQKAGVLKIGTTMDFVPMSYIANNGELKGYDIELAKLLAASLGVRPYFIKTTWRTLTQDTLDGKFDVALSGIVRNPKRMAIMFMSKGYLSDGRTIICRKKDEKKYTSWEKIDRLGVRIMNNPGGGNDRFAAANVKKATRIIHTPNNEIPELIALGKADVMITESIEALYYIKDDSRLAAPCIEQPFTGAYNFGILTRKGDTDFMRYLDFFIENCEMNGTIARLKEQI